MKHQWQIENVFRQVSPGNLIQSTVNMVLGFCWLAKSGTSCYDLLYAFSPFSPMQRLALLICWMWPTLSQHGGGKCAPSGSIHGELSAAKQNHLCHVTVPSPICHPLNQQDRKKCNRSSTGPNGNVKHPRLLFAESVCSMRESSYFFGKLLFPVSLY